MIVQDFHFKNILPSIVNTSLLKIPLCCIRMASTATVAGLEVNCALDHFYRIRQFQLY